MGFVSITENLDFTTPWGKLTLAVLGTLAEIYIDKLSAETSKGKRARARKGLYNGTIPFGYCKGDCSTCTDPNGPGYCPRHGGPDLCEQDPEVTLWLHPIESVAMQLAFQWYATGKYAQGEIARAPQPITSTGWTMARRSGSGPRAARAGAIRVPSARRACAPCCSGTSTPAWWPTMAPMRTGGSARSPRPSIQASTRR